MVMLNFEPQNRTIITEHGARFQNGTYKNDTHRPCPRPRPRPHPRLCSGGSIYSKTLKVTSFSPQVPHVLWLTFSYLKKKKAKKKTPRFCSFVFVRN